MNRRRAGPRSAPRRWAEEDGSAEARPLAGGFAPQRLSDEGFGPLRALGSVAGGLVSGARPAHFEFEDAAAEIAEQRRSRIVLAARRADLAPALLARIRGQPLPTSAASEGALLPGEPIQDEGVFLLVHLEPAAAGAAAPDDTWAGDGAAAALAAASQAANQGDCLLYLWAWGDGWQEEDSRWYARLRASGQALLPLALYDSHSLATPSQFEEVNACLQRRLGVRPRLVGLAAASTQPLDDELGDLLAHLLELCPRLAIPLAQEAPGFRPRVLQRVLRTAALMSALLGADPLPLVDLPLLLLVQWKAALQIAAIYGRPALDYRSREMLAALALSLLPRTLAQPAWWTRPRQARARHRGPIASGPARSADRARLPLHRFQCRRGGTTVAVRRSAPSAPAHRRCPAPARRACGSGRRDRGPTAALRPRGRRRPASRPRPRRAAAT